MIDLSSSTCYIEKLEVYKVNAKHRKKQRQKCVYRRNVAFANIKSIR